MSDDTEPTPTDGPSQIIRTGMIHGRILMALAELGIELPQHSTMDLLQPGLTPGDGLLTVRLSQREADRLARRLEELVKVLPPEASPKRDYDDPLPGI